MRAITLIFVASLVVINSYGQKERKYIRQGNNKYEKENYTEAEISYRKAMDKKPASAEAAFNIGDALYKQGKYEEAGKQFQSMTQLATDKNTLSKAFYNLGNSYFKTNKLQESADAYKNALRANPSDADAKYNLSLVQKLLKQQQQQNKDNKENKDDKNKQDQKDQQNKQQQDQQKQQDQQNKDQQKQDQQKQDQQNQQQQNQQQQQAQQQEKPGQISREDAQRLLEAIKNDEKAVQMRVQEQKAKEEKVKAQRRNQPEKNW
jgi:tetratricopeptide (TPR) repeat protein